MPGSTTVRCCCSSWQLTFIGCSNGNKSVARWTATAPRKRIMFQYNKYPMSVPLIMMPMLKTTMTLLPVTCAAASRKPNLWSPAQCKSSFDSWHLANGQRKNLANINLYIFIRRQTTHSQQRPCSKNIEQIRPNKRKRWTWICSLPLPVLFRFLGVRLFPHKT